MKGIPQGRYTREFREEAVKLVMEEKLSLPEAARRLSLAPSTLGYWVKAFRIGKLGDIGKSYRPLTEIEMELATSFHWFYKKCRVITKNEPLTQARLKLVKAAQITLAKTLTLMGMSAPERM